MKNPYKFTLKRCTHSTPARVSLPLTEEFFKRGKIVFILHTFREVVINFCSIITKKISPVCNGIKQPKRRKCTN